VSGIRVYDPVAEERSALAAPRGVVRIGRESDCELVLADDLEISRRHAEVRPGPEGRFELRDPRSRNGTFLNGERVAAPVQIFPGDEIRVGETTLRVEALGRTTSSARAAAPPPGHEGRCADSR